MPNRCDCDLQLRRAQCKILIRQPAQQPLRGDGLLNLLSHGRQLRSSICSIDEKSPQMGGLPNRAETFCVPSETFFLCLGGQQPHKASELEPKSQEAWKVWGSECDKKTCKTHSGKCLALAVTVGCLSQRLENNARALSRKNARGPDVLEVAISRRCPAPDLPCVQSLSLVVSWASFSAAWCLLAL